MQPLPQYQYSEEYPESDGQPMAESTEQYDWLVKIKENLEILFKNRPDVFIAGDLLWYPVQGKASISVAPDVFVAIGRPKGKRGSYKQWEEDNIAPQVVFEILSFTNTGAEMERKRQFYERYGVQEYYLYDPSRNRLDIKTYYNNKLQTMPYLYQWDSPLLGIRFILDRNTLHILYPDGQPFLSSIELNEQAEQERLKAKQASHNAELANRNAELASRNAELANRNAERANRKAEKERIKAEKERLKAEKEHANAEQARLNAEQERQRAERLIAQLKALGIDPNC